MTLPIPRRLGRSLPRRFGLRLRVEATDAAGNRTALERKLRVR